MEQPLSRKLKMENSMMQSLADMTTKKVQQIFVTELSVNNVLQPWEPGVIKYEAFKKEIGCTSDSEMAEKLIQYSLSDEKEFYSNELYCYFFLHDLYKEIKMNHSFLLAKELLLSDEGEEIVSFSITTYYDPYGDGKSDRKVHGFKKYASNVSSKTLKVVNELLNNNRSYYNQAFISIKQYKKVVTFSKEKLLHIL